MRYKYTTDDIKFLKENYPQGNWDIIFQRFPFLTKSSIHKKCHRLGIKSENTHRQNFDVSKNRKSWSETEIRILKDNYAIKPMEDLLQLLPERNKNMIVNQATRLQLISYNKVSAYWKEEEIQYIIDNWEITPDKIMAEQLNRTFRAVKSKREELGLYRQNKDNKSYSSLSKFLRGQNQQWKKNSMKECNYQCILSGSKDFEIHHLYSVSNIIRDIFKIYPQYTDLSFDEYNEQDLSLILSKFLEIQSNYPLGVCIDKQIHTLFHSMYGQYCNTPKQWYKFYEDYKKGLYIV